ncbi:MAG: CDP-diacylglycerol--glycerol-3-phosphate 3-phosphatidyltransferase [Leptospirales bacterium]
MNIPNLLTISRFIIIPFFLYMVLQDTPSARLIAFVLFAIAGLTDLLDGYLARKWSQDTKLGRFLDPLADKFLVITCLGAFYYIDHQISLWMILVIVGRDLMITVIRFLAIRKGMELRTNLLAKTKTVLQMTAIAAILLILVIRSYGVDIQQTFDLGHKTGKTNFEITWSLIERGISMTPVDDIERKEKRKYFAESIPYFLILLVTLVTVISGMRYLQANYRVLAPPYYLFRKKEDPD